MNVHEMLYGKQFDEIANPNYNKRSKKGRTESPTIAVPRLRETPSDAVLLGRKNLENSFAIEYKDIKKYEDYGLTYDRSQNMDKLLAQQQGWLEQTFNAVAQTLVSEVFLGTIRGFSDLVDGFYNLVTGQDNDYSNPVSQTLKEWQDKFNNEVMPIYTDPDKTWSSWGWYMSNIPSIMSSLTLMIPSTGVAKAASFVGKATKLGKLGGKTSRAVLNALGAEKITEKMQAGNRMLEFGINGFTSRILENYQESNQVYSDMIPEAYNDLKRMSDADYNKYIAKYDKELGENLDTNNRYEVAKRIAKKSADETFKQDLVNGLFDVYQLYALRNLPGIIKGNDIAKVRRLEKVAKANPKATSVKELETILAQRSFGRKVIDKTEDVLYRGHKAFLAELSEGVEESVNFIAQEEGMRYGRYLLGRDVDNRDYLSRLQSYALAPQFWESAFWGVVGGIMFNAGASKFNAVKRGYDINKRKKEFLNSDAGQQLKDAIEVSNPWTRDSYETENRIKELEYRLASVRNVNELLHTITVNHENPFVKDENGKNVKFNIETETGRKQEQALKEKVINDHLYKTLVNAMFSGNYNMTTNYLASEELKQMFVDSGALTKEQADKYQREAINIAEEIEKQYNDNVKAIDNALNTAKRKGKNIDVPYEYFQAIALNNMSRQRNIKLYSENLDDVNSTILSEESRLFGTKSIDESGVVTVTAGTNNNQEIYNIVHDDFLTAQNAITAQILLHELSLIQAKIKEIKRKGEKGSMATTVTEQHELKKLEDQKELIRTMLVNNTTLTGNNLKGFSLSAYQTLTSIEFDKDGNLVQNKNNELYKAIDKAISATKVSKAQEDLDKLNKLLVDNGFGNDDLFDSIDELMESEVASQLFNEKFNNYFKKDGAIEKLKNVSEELVDAYGSKIVYEKEIAKERQGIIVDADEILNYATDIHNEFINNAPSHRKYLIENATDDLKEIYRDNKKLFDFELDNTKSIDDLLSNEKDNLTYFRERLSDDDYKKLTNALKVLSLDNSLNKNITEYIANAINQSRIEDFLDIANREQGNVDEDGNNSNTTHEEEIEKNKKKKSTTSEQANGEPKIEQPTDKPQEKPEPRREQGNGATANPFVKGTSQSYSAMITFDDEGTANKIAPRTPANASKNYDIMCATISDPNYPDTVTLALKEEAKDFEEDEDLNRSPAEILKDFGQFFTIKTPLSNGGVIVSNPVIKFNTNGDIVSITPGIVENPAKVQGNESEDSSTGGQDSNSEAQASEDDGAVFVEELGENNGEDAAVELNANFILDEEVRNAIMESSELIVNTYNAPYEEAYKYIVDFVKTTFPNLSNEEFTEVVDWTVRWVNSNARAENDQIKIHTQAIVDYLNSDLLDSEIHTDDSRKQLAAAFKKILDNYAKRHFIDETKDGKKRISLTNLLQYCIQVTDNEDFGKILCDRFYNSLLQDDNYIIEEETERGINTKRVITDAQNATQEFKNDNRTTGLELDLNFVLRRFNDNSEDSKKEKEKISKLLSTVKPGDKLTYEVNKAKDGRRTITFKLNGVTIAENNAGVETANNTIAQQNGWLVDIPKANDGSQSKFGNILQELLVTGVGEDYDNLRHLLNKYYHSYHQARNKFDNEADYHKANVAFKEIYDAIKKCLGESRLTEVLGLTQKYYTEERAASYILNIYRDIKNVSDKQLAEADMTRDELEESRKLLRSQSINKWINKLAASFNASQVLIDNPNSSVYIDNVSTPQINIIPENEALRVNDPNAIGKEHKGNKDTSDNIHLAVASVKLENSGTIFMADGTSFLNPSMSRGSTFITIPSKNGNPQLVHAYPILASETTTHTQTREVYNEVRKQLRNLFNAWSNDVNKSADDIFKFIDILCSTKNGNAPIFSGLKVYTTNAGHRTIEFFENGQRQFIKFFDKSKFSKDGQPVVTSIIQFPGEKYSPNNTKELIKENLNKLLSIVERNLKFALTEEYIRGMRSTKGAARISEHGEFIITVPFSNKQFTFSSYEDMIINEGLVRVTTRSENGSNNFAPVNLDKRLESGFISYSIVGYTSSPVEESNNNVSESNSNQEVDYKQEIEKVIEEHNNGTSKDATIFESIAKVLLSDGQLKELKSSKLLRKFSAENVIFAEKSTPNSPVASYIKSTDTITLYDKFINRAKEGVEGREEVFRQYLHENIHRTIYNLPKEIREEVYNKIRQIFDEFVKYDETHDNKVNVFFKGLKEENGTLVPRRKEYYKNGQATNALLEEFLVESLTRPYLIQYLNNIPVDGKTISNQSFGNTKSKNLFQSILSVIAKIFNLKLNRNSLLEKEYKLFKEIAGINEDGATSSTKKSNNSTNSTSNDNNSDDEIIITKPKVRKIESKQPMQPSSPTELSVKPISPDISSDVNSYNPLDELESAKLDKEINTPEMEQIKAETIANGTFMKAPNGNPTNLTERQWLQVRTKAFKEWFGDWENDAANASKVVDENGEPMVVYHGSKYKFTIFKNKYETYKETKYIDDYEEAALNTFTEKEISILENIFKKIDDNPFIGLSELSKEEDDLYNKYTKTAKEFRENGKQIIQHYNIGNFFTTDKNYALSYGDLNIYSVFLNIRNPKDSNNLHRIYTSEESINTLTKEGYDGMRGHDVKGRDVESLGKEYFVINPNQIKSAIDNIGTFSNKNDDIRYSELMDSEINSIPSVRDSLNQDVRENYENMCELGIIETNC